MQMAARQSMIAVAGRNCFPLLCKPYPAIDRSGGLTGNRQMQWPTTARYAATAPMKKHHFNSAILTCTCHINLRQMQRNLRRNISNILAAIRVPNHHSLHTTALLKRNAVLLHRQQRTGNGQPLKRDVIFLALADEETGGEFGAQWMAREHAHLISDAEYALNEGGGGVMVVNGQRYITIQAGEKGTSRFYLRARGKPGHGSVPQPEASIVRLAAAVQRLGSNYLPVHLTQTVRSSLAVLMQTQPPAVAAMFADLLQTGDADRIVPQLPMEDFERRMLQAQLRNTAMPTIFQAGRQLNVIPDFAEAGIDGRLLPGCTRAEFHAELLQVLGDAGRDVQLEWHPHFGPALETESAGPLTNIIREVLAETDPALHLLPTLVTGGTDAKAFVPLGIKVLGYSPQPPTDTDTFNRAHAHDERLHTDSFHYCVRNTFEIVERFVTRSA